MCGGTQGLCCLVRHEINDRLQRMLWELFDVETTVDEM
jgi:hypothetical protein